MNNWIYRFFALFIGIILFESCTNPAELRKHQYTSMGRLVYQKQCINCHQADGKGLGTLYPDLNSSEMLQKSPLDALCLIKYGSASSTEVKMKMPAFSHLKTDELAKVLNFLNSTWGKSDKFYDDEDVERALKNCFTDK